MTLLNLIGFQLVWIACVAGAGSGAWWPGVAALALFAGWELLHSENVRTDLGLLVRVCALGLVVDSVFAASGTLVYAAALPSQSAAPVWILALWAGFALTLRRSLRWLMGRPWLAALLGGVFGPLSYWIAGSAWGAVDFAAPTGVVIALLAVAWAVAMPVCVHFAERPDRAAGARSLDVLGT
jgi:hypothetical protein